MNLVKFLAGLGIISLVVLIPWASLKLDNVDFFIFHGGMLVALALMVLVDLYFKKEKKNNEQE